MSIQITDISNVLEKVIAPAIQSQLFESNFLLKWLPKNSGVTKLENNSFYLTVIGQRNPSVVFMGVGSSTLPTTTKNITSQAQIPAAYGYGVLQFDDRTIEATKSSKGALQSIVEIYSDQLRRDIAKDMNRQMFRDGNGTVAILKTTLTTVTSPQTFTLYGSADAQPNTNMGTEYIVPGSQLIINSIVVTVASVLSSTTFSGTFTGTQTFTSGQKFAKYDGAAVAVEMNGLGIGVDDGSRTGPEGGQIFQTIDASTNPWWKGFVASTNTALP